TGRLTFFVTPEPFRWQPSTARRIFWRGLRMKCPRCGAGPIFRRWWTYTEYTQCPHCQLPYDPRGESLAFMYLSTAFLTGVMFIVLIVMPPKDDLLRYRVGLVLGALALYELTVPVRKGRALALNSSTPRKKGGRLSPATRAPAAKGQEHLSLSPQRMLPGHKMHWLFGGAQAYPAMLDS